MKRVLTILAILLLPLSVWAMTPVTDSDLSNVTGQAGVNINADLTMDISIGTMAWGDADGISTVLNPWATDAQSGGYVGIKNFAISNLQIKARYDSADNYNSYNTLFLKPITIDVATGTSGWKAGKTFVRFGIGALKITMNQLQFDVALAARSSNGGTDKLGTAGLDQIMGRVTLGAMEVYMNPWSYVDIYSHNGCGVNFDMAITIDRFIMPYMSWGDTDGVGTYGPANVGSTGAQWQLNANNSAGYVGLSSFAMGDTTHPAITIDGSVAIDVSTSAHGIYTDLEFLFSSAAACHSEADAIALITADGLLNSAGLPLSSVLGTAYALATTAPRSVVHISFPNQNFAVTVAKMTANVSLGNAANFTGVTQTLGDIYIQGLNLTIYQNSWVDIWAH